MRLLPLSAKYTFPALSAAIPAGEKMLAESAGTPSPEKAPIPVPATVVMMPEPAATLRMRLLDPSVIYIFPALSKVRYLGLFRLAIWATPPSPAKFGWLLPTTVVIIPVPAATMRILWFIVSTIYKFPAASVVTPLGPPRADEADG